MTPRLLETLRLLCLGYSNREIAERVCFSEEAIKDHVKRLLALFGARRRAHLAALAVAEGYVNEEELREGSGAPHALVLAGGRSDD